MKKDQIVQVAQISYGGAEMFKPGTLLHLRWVSGNGSRFAIYIEHVLLDGFTYVKMYECENRHNKINFIISTYSESYVIRQTIEYFEAT